jgi:AcrR family transcriptional regulator
MSNSNAQHSTSKRPYRLGKRAAAAGETRRRIVEAAIALHSTVGPANTAVAQIAERAGVQRHTYYAHFPTERDLLLACSGLALERDPLPNLGQLEALPKGRAQIEEGLTSVYAWFERNHEMAACVLRDAEHHALTREIVQLRMAPVFDAIGKLLSEGLSPRQQSLLRVALDFSCWRTLGREYSPRDAASLMSDAISLAPSSRRDS